MPLPLAEVAPVAFNMFGRAGGRRPFRIAILSEGFLPSEMSGFRIAALQVVRELLSTQPFKRQRDRLSIVRIDCQSRASAQVLEAQEPAPRDYRNKTPFDVRFDLSVARGLHGDRAALRAVLQAVPGLGPMDAALVILNSDLLAGQADGDAAWLSTHQVGPAFVHELGHAGFGLGDEYEILLGTKDEPPHTRTSTSEPTAPNLTLLHKTRETIPWKHLLTPGVPIPTTVVGGPCQFNHDALPAPSRAVGLFEGGDHNSCGIFRPSAKCKMRDVHDDFCLVCEQTIFARLAGSIVDARPPLVFPADEWTHAVSIPPRTGSDAFNIATYNARSGRLAIVFGENMVSKVSSPTTPHGEIFIDQGFHSLAGFVSDNRTFLALDNLVDQRKLFRVDELGLFSGGQSPAFIEEFQQPAQVLPVFGFSHMLALSIGGQSVQLRYDRITGGLELETVLPILPVPTTLASTAAGSLSPWHKELSSLTSLNIAGIPHVVGIDASAGTVVIARAALPIGPQPMTMLVDTFPPQPGFLPPFQTHALGFTHRGSPMLLTYSSLDGVAHLYEVRPDQSGIDFVFRWSLTPGARALFDVGLPAFGVISRADGDALIDHLWFYNAGLQSFSVTRLR